MKTGLIGAICSYLLFSIAFAESAAGQPKPSGNRMIVNCEFEDQRTVMLSLRDGGIVWRENNIDYPTSDWTHIRITGDPVLSVFAYGVGIGSPRLDIYQGVANVEKPSFELGTAILSETLVGRDRLLIEAVEGFCQTEQQN